MRLLSCLPLIVLHRGWAEEQHPPAGNGPSARADLPMPGDLLTTLNAPPDPIAIGTSWVLQYVIHNRLAVRLRIGRRLPRSACRVGAP